MSDFQYVLVFICIIVFFLIVRFVYRLINFFTFGLLRKVIMWVVIFGLLIVFTI